MSWLVTHPLADEIDSLFGMSIDQVGDFSDRRCANATFDLIDVNHLVEFGSHTLSFAQA